MIQADMKEYSLAVAAQVESEKTKKARQRDLEKTSRTGSLASPTTNHRQSQKDELRKGLAEGVMYKQLQKVNSI